jgi:hypothetical protein
LAQPGVVTALSIGNDPLRMVLFLARTCRDRHWAVRRAKHRVGSATRQEALSEVRMLYAGRQPLGATARFALVAEVAGGQYE